MKLLALAAAAVLFAWLLRRALPLDPFDQRKPLPNVDWHGW